MSESSSRAGDRDGPRRGDPALPAHALLAAIPAAVVAAWPIFRIARDWPGLADRVLLVVYFFVGFAAAALLSAAAARAWAGFRKRSDRRSVGVRALWIHLLLFVPFAVYRYEAARPTYLFDPPVGFPIALAALVLVPISLFLARRIVRFEPPAIALALAHLLLFLPVLAEADRRASPALPAPVAPAGPRFRVCHLQYDGISHGLVERFIGEGILPNFEALLARGARADLLPRISELNPFIDSASRGMRSPVVWTSINTGRASYHHGIHDFEATGLALLVDPIPFRVPLSGSPLGRLLRVSRVTANRTFVREPFVWEIAEAAGLLSGTIGAQVTSPVSPTRGFLIANEAVTIRKQDLWYPPDLFTAEEEERFRDPSIEEEMERWFGFSSAVDIDKPFGSGSLIERYGYVSSRIFRRDHRLAQASLSLLDRTEPDLFTLYFCGSDDSQHYFWKHTFCPEAPIEPEERRRFCRVIPNYLRFLDFVTGEMERRFDPEKTVFIISADHGLGPYDLHPSFSRLLNLRRERHQFNTGSHRRRAFFLIAGPPIRGGVRMSDVREVDLTPTILYLLGLPVAEDMDGEVITGALDPDFLRRNPVRSVPSYSALASSGEFHLEDDAETRERLKSLGYVE
ncbi:MAG: alkaline phosphatase family protein [Candidatus Eisenbacteria bacterium]